jgi:hypothetical protein
LSADLSLDQISDTLTTKEQLRVTQLTALEADAAAAQKRNLATFIARTQDIGAVLVVAAGSSATGTKILDNKSVFVSGALQQVDVYRQPV